MAVVLGTFAVAGPAQATSSNNSVKKLTKSVTLAGVLRHLVAFQAIASLNGGNRASGGPGYDRSADYVATLMRLAGYRVTRQSFPFNFCEDTGSSFARTAPTATTYVDQVDYDVMDCSGNGTATGLVVPVDLQLADPVTSSSGCEAADFGRRWRAISRSCSAARSGRRSRFGMKVTNAEAAGAIGAILMNQGNATGPGPPGPVLRHARQPGRHPGRLGVVPAGCRARRHRGPQRDDHDRDDRRGA